MLFVFLGERWTSDREHRGPIQNLKRIIRAAIRLPPRLPRRKHLKWPLPACGSRTKAEEEDKEEEEEEEEEAALIQFAVFFSVYLHF